MPGPTLFKNSISSPDDVYMVLLPESLKKPFEPAESLENLADEEGELFTLPNINTLGALLLYLKPGPTLFKNSIFLTRRCIHGVVARVPEKAI